MRQHRGRRRRLPVALLGLLAGLAVGCSDGAAEAPIAATAASAEVPSTDGIPAPSAAPSEAAASSEAPPATSTETASAGTASTETIATVPDERVPGLDSTDGFCRGWSEFAGSYQALAFASAAGSDVVAAARLEVVASGAVSAAVQALSDEFPESIAFERDLFVDDVIGPFARRAGRASDELRAAGLSSDQIEQLAGAWLTALTDAGVDEPAVIVDVPDDLSGAVDAATSAFSADVPTIVADPSLVTDATAPATSGYLAENCPDQGILGGNDAIG